MNNDHSDQSAVENEQIPDGVASNRASASYLDNLLQDMKNVMPTATRTAPKNNQSPKRCNPDL